MAQPLSTTALQQTAPGTDPLGRLLYALAVLALALAPTQLLIPHLPLTAAEVVLVLAALVWVLRWRTARDTRSLPPAAHWYLVLAGVLSVVSILLDQHPDPGQRSDFVKKTLEAMLYLLMAVTVFRATLTSPRRIRTAVIVLLATTSLAVLLAVAQRAVLQRHYQPNALQRAVFLRWTPRAYLTVETPLAVCSTFGSWNEKGFHPSRVAYAGFLALTLPFALALLAVARRRVGIMLWLGLLGVGVAVSVLAGYLVPALLLGLLVTGCALGRRTGWLVVGGVVGYLALLALVGGHNRTEVLREPARLQMSASDAQNPNYQYDGFRHVKKFWGEQQAAVNLLRGTTSVANPALFGVGNGQYQKHIQDGYGGLSATAIQRLESDAQNGYLLTAVNTGILGLATLLALYGVYLRQAWRQARAQRGNPWAAAQLGAMVVLVIMTLATYPLVHGTALVIAALLAMIGNQAAPTSNRDVMEH